MRSFGKKLFLLRHGETEFNKTHILQGQVDSPLTELGIKQANEAGEKVKGLGIDVMVASDMKRTVKTAEIVSGIIGIPVTRTDSAFRERDFGKIDGAPLSDIRNKYPEFILENGLFILEHDVDGAEPIKEFYNRVTYAVENLMKEFEGKNVMVVTHKGVLNMMYAYINDVPLDKIRTVYNPDNCAIENY